MCFEEMSGLKINYHKSEVMVMGQPPEIMQRVADMLNSYLRPQAHHGSVDVPFSEAGYQN
jgi:hypothetical protein